MDVNYLILMRMHKNQHALRHNKKKKSSGTQGEQ